MIKTITIRSGKELSKVPAILFDRFKNKVIYVYLEIEIIIVRF